MTHGRVTPDQTLVRYTTEEVRLERVRELISYGSQGFTDLALPKTLAAPLELAR